MALANSDANRSGFNTMVRDMWLSANHMSLFTQLSPIFKMLQLQGSIQKAGYGTKMIEPLRVPVPTGPQLAGVTDPFATQTFQGMTGYTEATYDLAEYQINYGWADYDSIRGGSPTEMVNQQQAHLENALDRSYNTVLSHFWAIPENAKSAGARDQIGSIRTFLNGGGTVATDGGSQPPAKSEQSAVPLVSATSATAVTTVGGIPRAAAGAAYWCTPLYNNTSGSQAAFSILGLSDVFNLGWSDSRSPNLIILPAPLFSKLESLLTVGGTNGGQHYDNSVLAKAGFNAIRWRNAEIIADDRCPTAGFQSGTSNAMYNHVYCINTKHLKLRMKSKRPTFKEIPVANLITAMKGSWYLALTSDHLGRVHSVGANFT